MEANLLSGENLTLTDTPFVEDMIENCRKRAGSVFMEDARIDKKITFGEYLSHAGSISSTLRILNQKPGKIITIISSTTIESITFCFGTWISGAATASINPNLPADEILRLVSVCKSQVIYCEECYLNKLRDATKDLGWETIIITPNGKSPLIDYYNCLEADTEEGLKTEGWWAGKDHALAVMFTSGTTGTPKGVILRDEAMKCNANMKMLWTENTRLLLTTPMYWISNAMGVTISTSIGCRLILATAMCPVDLVKAITAYKPTEWFTGPSILLDMCQQKELDQLLNQYDMSSFERISVGGSVLFPEHRKLIVQKILGGRNIIRLMYGSTEAGMVTYDPSPVPMDSPQFNSVGQVGRGVTLKVLDQETGKTLPPYCSGELCVKSRSVLKQYLNKIISEDELDKDGFWHMGDLGYYDEEGYVYYMSRLKDIMKFRGQQIAPAELETVIQRHQDVIESCVVGKPCVEQGGDLPTAFVVKRPGSTVTEQQLYDFVAENVIDEKNLRGGIYFVKSLPRSAIGKILRHVLQERITSGSVV